MSTAVFLPTEHDDAWHAARRLGLGASEVPMVLGESPYGDARKVYLLKKGLIEPDPETELMEIGTLAEPMLLELYRRRTGHAIERTQYRARSAADPFLFATVDALRADGRHVECKTTGLFTGAKKQLGRIGSDEIPYPWELQCQTQMYCLETDICDVAVLIAGQDFRVYTIRRNDRLLAVILPLLRDFWGQVERGECPPSSGQDSPAMLAAINPAVDGSFPLSAAGVEAAARYELLGKVEKEAKEEREKAKVALLLELCTLEFGLLPDGRRVKRYLEDVPARVNNVKAHKKHYIKIVKGEFGS